MQNPIRFWPQPLFGLDIQTDEIRLLQLQGIFKKKSIKEAITLQLPSGAVIDGKIQEADTVRDCLQTFVRNQKYQTPKVAIALSQDYVVSERISVTKGLTQAELESEVIHHLRQHMPGAAEGLCYDYILESATDPMQEEVFIIATSYANLTIPLSVVQQAGLKVHVVDVDQYALNRAHQFLEQDGISIEEKWLLSFGLALWCYRW